MALYLKNNSAETAGRNLIGFFFKLMDYLAVTYRQYFYPIIQNLERNVFCTDQMARI